MYISHLTAGVWGLKFAATLWCTRYSFHIYMFYNLYCVFMFIANRVLIRNCVLDHCLSTISGIIVHVKYSLAWSQLFCRYTVLYARPGCWRECCQLCRNWTDNPIWIWSDFFCAGKTWRCLLIYMYDYSVFNIYHYWLTSVRCFTVKKLSVY